jgi:penicillin-binding protein 2
MKTENFASLERKSVIYFVIIAAFSLLGFRLFQMQILDHHVYDEKSVSNSVKDIEQIPLRGIFYDRNMNVVVNNVPAYTIRITPSEYDHKLTPLLETVLDVKHGYIDDILKNDRIYSKYIPVRIKRGIDFKVVSWLEENSEHLPGVDYIVEMQRGYPDSIRGSQMFGYTKEISPQSLESDTSGYYKPGDYVGSNGIEKAYENILRGKKGNEYMLVDSRRRELGKYKDGKADLPSVKGNDLVLTIDANLQRIAERDLKGKRGAVVAIEPKTGEILIMASAPDFDLNEFSYVTSRGYLKQLYDDPAKPFFNRVTMSIQPPGSTFKPLEAIAALDMGVITTSSTFTCKGGATFFGRYFKCDAVHGTLNVVHAIEHSCNVFFYNLIYKIGLDKWHEYALRFGFGKETGLDIGNEEPGFIPDSKYYEKRYGPDWPKSIMASLGIGQGEVSVTPLQLAQYCSLIADDGVTYSPHLVRGYLDNVTHKLIKVNNAKKIDVHIDKKIFDIAKEGMFLVVNGNGTAASSRIKDIQMAGKTGTAQNPHGKDHAWFIGFAPYNNPKIAIAVFVENVGFGAQWAAPIARDIVEEYLKGDNKNEIKTDGKIVLNQSLGEKKNEN